MEENSFWFRLWALGAAIIIFGMASCTVISLDTRSKWDRAVTNGADPMVVSCALNLSGNDRTTDAIICNTLAQNRK